MIVRGESTIIDYHAPFDQGLLRKTSKLNQPPIFLGVAFLLTRTITSFLVAVVSKDKSETLKRAVRDLDSKSSADQLTLLENVFKDDEHTKTAKRSRTTNSHTDGHRLYRIDSLPKYHEI